MHLYVRQPQTYASLPEPSVSLSSELRLQSTTHMTCSLPNDCRNRGESGYAACHLSAGESRAAMQVQEQRGLQAGRAQCGSDK